MRFKVGDEVWVATSNPCETFEPCPDCGGEGRLRVTFHDETTVSIECQNCTVGFSRPTGRISVVLRTPRAEKAIITGVQVDGSGIEWTAGCYIYKDEDVFEGEAPALARAEIKSQEHRAYIQSQMARREKPERTWAWHASYHRKEIKRAEAAVAHHSAKLAVASLKAKEPRT